VDQVARIAREATPNNVLFNLRNERGWTQQDEADELNKLAAKRKIKGYHVSPNTVSRWERGIIPVPEPLSQRLLADLHDVTLDQLGFTRPRPVREHRSDLLHQSRSAVAGLLGSIPLCDPPPMLEDRVQASQRQWVLTRKGLNQHRIELSREAARWHRSCQCVGRSTLLTRPSWTPAAPVEFGRVELDWSDEQTPSALRGSEHEARGARPLTSGEQRYARYVHAVRDLDPPRLFENRLSFRLRTVDCSQPGQARLGFGMTTYFDAVDVCETLAHEVAAAYVSFLPDGFEVRHPAGRRLPFRKLVGNPLDLDHRLVGASIDTLTIRRSGSSASFVLHQRDASRVAVAGGMYHVMPAGVFQPSSMATAAQTADFDLWRNVMREYSEEYLGNLEHDGNASAVIDYDQQEPFRSLNAAVRGGKVRVFFLGVGLDPLTLWGEILTAAVFDDDAFDELFGSMLDHNHEGTVVRVAHPSKAAHYVPFTEERVDQLVETEPLAPAAAACLELAWRDREALLDTAR
jgi:transcriptional regulator with XRE-family HTH domain